MVAPVQVLEPCIVVCLGIMNKSASEVWDKKESSEVVKHQTLPFMDRKTTVFVDIARAKPKSQSCNRTKKNRAYRNSPQDTLLFESMANAKYLIYSGI